MSLETAEIVYAKPPSVFLNRNFMLYFSGRIISQMGDHLYAFALSWYILEITSSSLQMAIFLVINTLIAFMIAPLGGIIADRLERKSIMVWTDIAQGMVMLVVAFLMYHQLLQIWMLYVSAIVLAFCGAIFLPAANAIIPNIVEENQLTAATSANQFTTSFCTMIGMLISGILYNWIGIFSIFLLNAISFFISGVMEFYVEIPYKKRNDLSKEVSFYQGLNKAGQELKEGYQYVKENKGVYYLLLMNAMFNLLALPIVMVYFPYLFNVILKATPLQLAVPQAAVWIGMIAGSILVTLFLHRHKLKNLVFWGFLIIGFYSLVMLPLLIERSYFNNWEMSIFCTLGNIICGLAASFFTIPMYVIFQKHISDEYRGRFWGLENSLRTLAMCSGFFSAGFLAQKVWLGFLFLITAIVLFTIGLWAINQTAIRELND